MPARAWIYIKSLKRRYQIGAAVILVVVIVAVAHFLSGTSPSAPAVSETPHVTVESVSSLSSATGPLLLTGKVTSLDEATILAETSGQIVSLTAHIGDRVAAGETLGQLENSSEQAAVKEAQGAYDAAIASQSSASPADAASAARSVYASAYATMDSTVHDDIDTVFGSPTAYGPQILFNSSNATQFSERRAAIDTLLDTWHTHLESAGTIDPATLLSEAYTDTQTVATFVNDLTVAAHAGDSRATATQIESLSTAQSAVAGLLSTISAAEAVYQSKNVGTTAGAAASVTQAEGALEVAKAALAKTVIRSPISGTIVSLPVNEGDFISAMSQVADISNPDALKIDVQVTPDDAKTLLVGGKATINNTIPGVIASIAPAVDPSTSKIPLTIDLTSGEGQLVDGDTATVSLERSSAPSATSAATITIPIVATKITPSGPIVFTVASSTMLVAHPVTLGAILGDRVTVVSGLSADTAIVTDARGLSDGASVIVDAP